MPDDLIDAQSAELARARWTTYLLLACVALDVAGILSAQHVGVLRLPVFIATAVAWLLWLHQAYRNLGLVGTMRSRFTPDRAVRCWFIPLINLVRPYQIVKELWQRSGGAERSGLVRRPTGAVVAALLAVRVVRGITELQQLFQAQPLT